MDGLRKSRVGSYMEGGGGWRVETREIGEDGAKRGVEQADRDQEKRGDEMHVEYEWEWFRSETKSGCT